MKPQDLAPIKQKLLDYLQDNPVRRAVSRSQAEELPHDARNELSPAARDAYQLIVAKTIIADDEVEPAEIARLYYLFTALDTSAGTRLAILRQLAFERAELIQQDVLPEILDSEELRFALARDTLLVSQVQDDDGPTQLEMQKVLGDLRLSPTQADVMFDWVALQNSVLRGLATGVEWVSSEENISEFARRAEKAGLPPGALILSGAKRIPVSDVTSTLRKLGEMTGIGLFKDPVRAGIALVVITGVTVVAGGGYLVSVASNQARERAAAAEMLAMELDAATRLAQDMPDFEEPQGFMRGKSRREMSVILHDALILMLEDASANVRSPQA